MAVLSYEKDGEITYIAGGRGCGKSKYATGGIYTGGYQPISGINSNPPNCGSSVQKDISAIEKAIIKQIEDSIKNPKDKPKRGQRREVIHIEDASNLSS